MSPLLPAPDLQAIGDCIARVERGERGPRMDAAIMAARGFEVLGAYAGSRRGQFRAVTPFLGFAAPGEPLRLASGRLPGSGLVLPAAPPTLAMLVRGRPSPRRAGAFDWPALATPGGLPALIREGLAAFGGLMPAPTRLVLTAHSGGGSGLVSTLEANAAGGARVDEAHLFDALYGDHTRLLRWAVARHALERAGGAPGALAVLARPNSATEAPVRRLAAGLLAAGVTGPRWRVLLTPAPHNDIPRLYGPALLVDAAAQLPATAQV